MSYEKVITLSREVSCVCATLAGSTAIRRAVARAAAEGAAARAGGWSARPERRAAVPAARESMVPAAKRGGRCVCLPASPPLGACA
eukprot:scaffold92636_cov32-Tisochrysis_lutea.AAC.4